MLTPDQTAPEFALPALDARVLARRAAVPALLAGAAVAAVLLGGGGVHAVAGVLRRGLGVSPG